MTIGITHKGIGHLVEGVLSSDLIMKLTPGDAQAFTTIADDYIYALLRSVTDREIVRIDIAASQSGTGELVVARGQGGSIAQDWAPGTLFLAVTNADHYNALIQRGEARQIAFNPNGVLTPLFASEKVYQNSPAGCERWWKNYNGVDPYWDIITGLPCGGEIYKDIGWTYDLLVLDVLICWNEYLIPALWDVLAGTWDGDSYTGPLWVILEATVGTWQQGFRPELMKITRATYDASTLVSLKDTSNFTIFSKYLPVGPNGTICELDWLFGNDMDRLTIQKSGATASIDVTGIEFFECSKEIKIGETSDGYTLFSAGTWPATRDAAAGSAAHTGTTRGIVCSYFSGGNYFVYRIFFFFDLSGITLTNIHTVSLLTRTYSITGSEDIYIIPVACDTGPPLTVDHYNDGYTALADPKLVAIGEQLHYFNAFGVDYISGLIGGMCAICVKEYTYDYLNVAPPGVNFINLYMAEQSASKPQLNIFGE